MKLDLINRKIKQCVLFAGGMGTRLKPFTDTMPKPMYPINGKPFIGFLLDQIVSFGIEEVILLLGYKSEKIIDYIEKEWDIYYEKKLKIMMDVTPVEFDTGARIKHVEDKLDEAFLLMYCDNYCTVDFNRLCTDFYENKALVQISAYVNNDKYTKDNLLFDDKGKVLIYDKSRTQKGLSGVEIGYAIVNSECVKRINNDNVNFEKSVYPMLVEEESLYATSTHHRYYSIGSWERIELTKVFLGDKKTIFLDRDGTLNIRPPRACYVEKPEQYIWIEGAKEAIQLLKKHNYRVIVVSNQPGIARGCLSKSDLNSIQKKMQDDLNEYDCNIDSFYYCEHNWDDGCECRKPKPGLFFQAQKDFSINLTECYMIGDDERDKQAAETAGCKCILVDDEYTVLSAVKEILGV